MLPDLDCWPGMLPYTPQQAWPLSTTSAGSLLSVLVVCMGMLSGDLPVMEPGSLLGEILRWGRRGKRVLLSSFRIATACYPSSLSA